MYVDWGSDRPSLVPKCSNTWPGDEARIVLTVLSESEEKITVLKVVFVHHMVNVVSVHQ